MLADRGLPGCTQQKAHSKARQRWGGRDAAYLNVGAGGDQSLRELQDLVPTAMQPERVQRRVVVREHGGRVGAGLEETLELLQIVGLNGRVQRRTARSTIWSERNAAALRLVLTRRKLFCKYFWMSHDGCAEMHASLTQGDADPTACGMPAHCLSL